MPLLPDRHPQKDFFILDISDVVPMDDMASMEHPLFSLATKQQGAFGWGEPSYVGQTLLGLLEQLPHPDEERQRIVLRVLEHVLQLLRNCSARALACELAQPSAPALSKWRLARLSARAFSTWWFA